MITTAVNGATRLTIASYLSVACFKEVVWDSTVQLIHGTKSVSNLGAIASNMCISPAILVSASNKATRITLSDFNKELAPKHDLAQPNPPFTGDISTPPASSSLNVIATEVSPITAYSTTPYSPWLTSTPIPRPKCFLLDSDTTVVAHDDSDDFVSEH